jgi:hypothetical protein
MGGRAQWRFGAVMRRAPRLATKVFSLWALPNSRQGSRRPLHWSRVAGRRSRFLLQRPGAGPTPHQLLY